MRTRTSDTSVSTVLFTAVSLLALSLALPGCGPATPQPTQPPTSELRTSAPVASPSEPAPSDLITPDGLPEIGKWMYDSSYVPARWLGETIEGKHLREPINVILVDGFATSVQDAKQRLVDNAQKAGYKVRRGHSSGYRGYIAGQFHDQLPEEEDHAFSDAPYRLDNNHGRIFGPVQVDGKYYFTGAFSRERAVPLAKVGHQYVSFDRARDDFAEKLSEYTTCEISAYVELENALPGDADLTTGDHDGVAVLISTTE